MPDDLPDPPVPADCDLRGMPGFMLNTERLMASELWALSTGEAFKAAMSLWCRAWRQVPAASLPDDDTVLRAFSGLSPAAWKRCKDMALRGFKRCNDGRLYHMVLAEDAGRAWVHRQRQRDKAEKRWSDATGMPRHNHGTPAAMPGESQGQGQGHRHIERARVDVRATPPAADVQPARAPDGIEEGGGKAGHRIALAKALRAAAMPAGDKQIEEWDAAMRGIGQCENNQEVAEGIEWIARRSAAEKNEIKYADQAKDYIRRWCLILHKRDEEARAREKAKKATA